MSLPSLFFPQLPMLSMTSYNFLVMWGQLSWLCPLKAPCAPLRLLVGEVVWQAQKALTLYKDCSTATKTSLSYQHYCQNKCETHPHTNHCEENYFYLQAKPAELPI